MLRLKAANRRRIPNALAVVGAILLAAGTLPGVIPGTQAVSAETGETAASTWLAEAPADDSVGDRELPSQAAIKRSKRLRVHLFLLRR